MLREVFVFGIILLYAETILQLYVVFQTTIPFTIFVSSLVLIVLSYILANITSLVWILKSDLQKPPINKTVCVACHCLQLGLIWRLHNLRSQGIERQILIIRFIHCGIQTIPFLILHGGVDLLQLVLQDGGIISALTLFISCLSLSISFSSYSLKYSLVNCDDSEIQKFGKRFTGVFLLCFGTFLMLATRIVTIILMASVVVYWATVPGWVHFILVFFTFMTCTKDITWKVKRCSPWNLCRFTALSFFHVFEMMESNLRIIQCKYVAFYALILVENIVMSAVWLLYSDKDYLTKLITVVFLLMCFVCALIAKYSGCYLLTIISEIKPTVAKSSVYVSKSECKSKGLKSSKKTISSLHHTTSAESQTTETVISRCTSGGTQNTDLDYESFNHDLIFPHMKSSFQQKASISKKHILSETNSLVRFTASSTQRSSPSIPGTAFVSSLNESDQDITLCTPRNNKRVTGRRGFKLGNPRPFTIHGGIFLDDSYLNSRTHLRNPNLHKRIQRTQSMYVDDTCRTRTVLPLNVNKLTKHPVWYTDSLSDSFSLRSDGDDEDYYNDEDTSVSKTTSSNTKLTFSSSDRAMWNSSTRPSFENLDRLPTKTVEADTRIKSWLLETVNIFDLIHEKTHEDHWTIRRLNGRSSSAKFSSKQTAVDNSKSFQSRDQICRKNSFQEHRPIIKHFNVPISKYGPCREQNKPITQDNRKNDTKRPSRLHGHKNSLKEIDKLKQFIQSTECVAEQSESVPPKFYFQKYRLNDRESKEVLNSSGLQTFPRPLQAEQQMFQSHQATRVNSRHQPSISVESLV
ncbi:hypothetical protein LOTGIDRAFT_166977 [Lottia gigantea]|uniref:XK-related protein n=1 Tax=Lottia gigantea TaxID=225164 RepID=V3Z777_LOTGI|nr:hypothetical protein LOTGIDRAFT_166977 [Lottia gigantea]ESO86703.1 hypothetical protein LOTGIDRAFT_166977 [Lottia gigantea]